MSAKKARRSKKSSTPDTMPKMRPIGEMRAQRLATAFSLNAKDLINKELHDLTKLLPPFLDWRYKKVCGQVVKRDPETGELHPVPFATVHVYDNVPQRTLPGQNGIWKLQQKRDSHHALDSIPHR